MDNVEIERRWLVFNKDDFNRFQLMYIEIIEQLYIIQGPQGVLRVRMSTKDGKNECYFTYKTSANLASSKINDAVSREYECTMDFEMWKALVSQLSFKQTYPRITKERYVYELPKLGLSQPTKLYLDVFTQIGLKGLMILEVEFLNIDLCNEFKLPENITAIEITGIPQFSNSNLAKSLIA